MASNKNGQLLKSYEDRILPNMATIHYIRQASTALDLPIRTTGTALCYYHRFQQFMSRHKGKQHTSNNQYVDPALALYTNEELLATTCLFLACKATEVPRKVRDLVNVGYRYYHPNDEILKVDETYFKMRSSLATSELLLVRALDCDLEVELPFSFCLNILRSMGSIPFYRSSSISLSLSSSLSSPSLPAEYVLQKEIWKRMENEMPLGYNMIARLAWMFVWDSLCSPKITLKHTVPEVALGCLYLALRTSYADLQMTMTEWVDKWGTADNISVQAVRDVALDVLELYELSNAGSSSSGSNSSGNGNSNGSSSNSNSSSNNSDNSA